MSFPPNKCINKIARHNFNDLQLIELVRKRDVLYNLLHEKYLDVTYKEAIWNKIGEQLNTDGATCRARWGNMRDQYRKTVKKTDTKGRPTAKIRPYKYCNYLSFLIPFFQDRKLKKKKRKRKNQDKEDEEDEDIQKKEITPQLPTHPIDAFLAGIAVTLKELSPYYQNMAKTEIFAVVQKYEMQMFNSFNASLHALS